MPWGIHSHSVVAINTSTIMLIGGTEMTGIYRAETFYFNPMDEKAVWIDGPSMLETRFDHASALLGDHVVTAGGRAGLTTYLSSVEILDLQSFPHQWTQGKLIMFCYV